MVHDKEIIFKMLGWHVTNLDTKPSITCLVMQMVFSRLARMLIPSGQAKLVYLTVQIGMLQQKHQFVIERLLESIPLIKLHAEKTNALDFVKEIIVKQLRRLRNGLPVIDLPC